MFWSLYLFSYKSKITETISCSSAHAISAFDLLVTVPLQEVRTVRLDLTPPLTAAASRLHFRRGASQTSPLDWNTAHLNSHHNEAQVKTTSWLINRFDWSTNIIEQLQIAEYIPNDLSITVVKVLLVTWHTFDSLSCLGQRGSYFSQWLWQHWALL